MKYFLIAGEASGDLHASHLMQSLLYFDKEAQFRFIGGDAMQRVGGTLLCHYSLLAYMGFVQVALHARTLLRGLATCKKTIEEWKPDAVVLIDYPGFNLKIAHYVHKKHLCPVFYYISPKIWAWKEHRIHAIRRDVDRLFSILPFEKDFFEKKHHYSITYVGNPTVDEVAAYKENLESDKGKGNIIALLPGSRKQEIKDNLCRMLSAVEPLNDYSFEIAMAPAISLHFYQRLISHSGIDTHRFRLIKGDTYGILSRATAALVTSGTATLETMLFGVPQVVCYYMHMGWLVNRIRPHFLKVPYISLVNLIAGREVVKELVANEMNAKNVYQQLCHILPLSNKRTEQLKGYADATARLGGRGASERTANEIVSFLKRSM